MHFLHGPSVFKLFLFLQLPKSLNVLRLHSLFWRHWLVAQLTLDRKKAVLFSKRTYFRPKIGLFSIFLAHLRVVLRIARLIHQRVPQLFNVSLDRIKLKLTFVLVVKLTRLRTLLKLFFLNKAIIFAGQVPSGFIKWGRVWLRKFKQLFRLVHCRPNSIWWLLRLLALLMAFDAIDTASIYNSGGFYLVAIEKVRSLLPGWLQLLRKLVQAIYTVLMDISVLEFVPFWIDAGGGIILHTGKECLVNFESRERCPIHFI